MTASCSCESSDGSAGSRICVRGKQHGKRVRQYCMNVVLIFSTVWCAV